MSERLDKLEANAESALDFDDTTVVVPVTLVREQITQLEEEIAALKRENGALRDTIARAMNQIGCEGDYGATEILSEALLMAKESG